MIDELKTKNIYFVYDQGFRIFRGRRHQLRNQSKKSAASVVFRGEWHQIRNPVKKVRSIRDRCFNNEIQLQRLTCAKAMCNKGILLWDFLR